MLESLHVRLIIFHKFYTFLPLGPDYDDIIMWNIAWPSYSTTQETYKKYIQTNIYTHQQENADTTDTLEGAGGGGLN